jgi:hypothetical protein
MNTTTASREDKIDFMRGRFGQTKQSTHSINELFGDCVNQHHIPVPHEHLSFKDVGMRPVGTAPFIDPE